MKRREFLEVCRKSGMSSWTTSFLAAAARKSTERRFHVCLNTEALEENPEILTLVRQAGIQEIWLAGFLYGYWYFTAERMEYWKRQIEKAGMACHAVNVPIGHPGDSLGAKSGKVPLTPPPHWKLGVQLDGKTFAGTSLHSPATEENLQALKKLQTIGVKKVFLDDDFRLARGPGSIGGCFCQEHRRRFLETRGFGQQDWFELLDSARNRKLTKALRAWIEFTCDELTASFRAQQAAHPGIQLGIMVMYLGSEKAGIRLADYNSIPFRVGELMFEDRSFTPAKGKTDELFSDLFHRRFVPPESAYSETTAYPANELSAAHLAAKLVLSTISDVRHTMYMSGLTPFPLAHWQILAPAMKKQAAIHKKIAGHKPAGPFKHYWGEYSRWIGNDKPFSLFLASGVPFEVTAVPSQDGWTFLSDFDAQAVVAGNLRSAGTTFVFPPGKAGNQPPGIEIGETMKEIFAFKNSIRSQLQNVPHIREDIPAVCAWYPTAQSVLIWNLSERQEELTLQYKESNRTIRIGGLDAERIHLRG